MSKPFHISADDIRCASLMARRDYYREHVTASLEGRLCWLKERPQSWPWISEERQRVEMEISEAQTIIAGIETEMRSMGKDADVLEGIHMDLNVNERP
jgi:hypothetical protein